MRPFFQGAELCMFGQHLDDSSYLLLWAGLSPILFQDWNIGNAWAISAIARCRCSSAVARAFRFLICARMSAWFFLQTILQQGCLQFFTTSPSGLQVPCQCACIKGQSRLMCSYTLAVLDLKERGISNFSMTASANEESIICDLGNSYIDHQ